MRRKAITAIPMEKEARGSEMDTVTRFEAGERSYAGVFGIGQRVTGSALRGGQVAVRFILHHLADAETVLGKELDYSGMPLDRTIQSVPEASIWLVCTTTRVATWSSSTVKPVFGR